MGRAGLPYDYVLNMLIEIVFLTKRPWRLKREARLRSRMSHNGKAHVRQHASKPIMLLAYCKSMQLAHAYQSLFVFRGACCWV